MVESFCLQKFLQVSAEQEYRRGGSYKVGLKAAGGSHVNAHSLTPTLPVPYSSPIGPPPTLQCTVLKLHKLHA